MLFDRKDVYTVNKLPLKGEYIHKLALFSIYFFYYSKTLLQ